MAFLEVKGVSKSYGAGELRSTILDDINLSVEEGEFVAIVGFSGSGKTTLVSAIAGLIQPDKGEILLRGQPLTGPGADRGVVFQSYSLMPWLTVSGNISLAVDSAFKSESKAARKARVARYIKLVGRRNCRGECASAWLLRAPSR